jgi:hypothetical protein
MKGDAPAYAGRLKRTSYGAFVRAILPQLGFA